MNVLAFFAHPDDETMLCGGALALLAAQGARITYLCATRGEGGDVGEPPLCERADLGRVRAAELACAVQSLGGGELVFLDYVDPLVGPGDELFPFTMDEDCLAEQVKEVILKRSIDVLLTHGSGGEYGHPAHRLCHRAARAAVARMDGYPLLFYTVQAAYEGHPKPRLMNPLDPADLVLDISPVREQKTAAALCHRTQNALFVRRTSQDLGRAVTVPEVIVLRESFHRVSPRRRRPVADRFARLLRSTGCVLSDEK